MLPPLALARLEVAMHEPPVPPRPEPPRAFLTLTPLERLRDRWDDPRVRVAALLVAALVAGLVWYQLGVRGRASASSSQAARPPASTPARPATDPGATTSTLGPGGLVLVHVAGAVARPGVVRVRTGARVVDAVEAAGGGLPGADLDRLNLAAKVADGQRIAVAVVGAPAPVEAGTSGGAGVTGSDPSGGTGPINVNTATSTELEELPGIGPTLAEAIVAERERRGGFQSVGELQDVRGIGEARYADIKDLVTV